jgi:CheY-like chemotaxis protein
MTAHAARASDEATGRRLLVVEDDADNSQLLQSFFAAHHYQVDTATRGPDGLQMARQGSYDLIVLDVNLPEMDGFAVLQALRASPRTAYVPVIFLTERADKSDRIRGLSLGAHDYVIKPYDLEELRLRVQAAIARAERDNLLDPRTGLPTGRLADDHVRRVQGQPGWHVLECRLESFRPFVDLNGFAAGDEVLKATARLLTAVLDQEGTPDDVVAHPAHDTFLVLTAAGDPAALAAHLRARFNDEIKAHYSFMDVEQGYVLIRDAQGQPARAPLMTLNVIEK